MPSPIEIEHQRAETLKTCKRIVWEYRDILEPYWPCPDIWDSLLFCQTELGEAIDAYLRTKQGYARNNEKELDVLDELADCALMAFTALGRDHEERCGWWKSYETVREIRGEVERFTMYASWVADALYDAVHFYDDVHSWRSHIVDLLNHLAIHPGMDLPARLHSRLERIRAKRLEAAR